MRINRLLLVFDKFKDALSAESICAEAAGAARKRYPELRVDTVPLTDGGEGFVSILTRHAGGDMRTVRVCGPRFAPVDAGYGRVDLGRLPGTFKRAYGFPDTGCLAVIEMARASGLQLLSSPERNPWVTTTHGTGELMAAATSDGAAAILLGAGGSATHDLGLGALAALGLRREPEARATESASRKHPGAGFVPECWKGIEAFSTKGMRPLPPVRIACDVENPLLGKRGAVYTFAPQKGAKDSDLPRLETATGRAARMLCRAFGVSGTAAEEAGAGAAGGIAFGLKVAYAARRVPGYDLVAEWLGLRERIETADAVITGEGRFDRGSLSGKGPGNIVKQAAALGKPAVVLAGAVDLSAAEREWLRNSGVRLEAITPEGMSLEEALPQTGRLLAKAVERAIAEFAHRSKE